MYICIYLSTYLSVECIKAARSAAEDSSIYIYIYVFIYTYTFYIYLLRERERYTNMLNVEGNCNKQCVCRSAPAQAMHVCNRRRRISQAQAAQVVLRQLQIACVVPGCISQ